MNETLSYLYNLRNRGSSFGIDRMSRFIELLEFPQESFPIIHVAGTNGKGSVCAMLDSIYRANGYNVGLFSSPHLVELGERVRVNGRNITDEQIQGWVGKLKSIAQQMEAEKKDNHPTFFEFMTAIAFLFFKQNKVDLAIIETGLGGRLDSTNVVKPELSIITTISKDHCSILGDCLEGIAKEKAGIIKEKTPVLVGWLCSATFEVVRLIAEARRAPFHTVQGLASNEWPSTNMQGSYQNQNASIALRASDILNYKLPVAPNKSKAALKDVKMLGRWQTIEGKPKIILDACHNSAGALCLRENLKNLQEKPEIWIGVLGEDRAKDIIAVVADFAKSIKLFEVNQPRACSFAFLRSIIPKSFKGEVVNFELQKVKERLFYSDSKNTILVTGSIYLIGDILSLLKSSNFEQKFNWSDIF